MSQQENVRALVPSYTGRIKVASGKALALAILLAKAAPPDLTPAQRGKLKALKAAGQTVEGARIAKSRMSGATIQPLRNQFAVGWGGLDLALEAVEQLPLKISDHPKRATELRARLFPSGREFTKLSAVEAWTHAQSIFRRMEEDDLEGEILDLVGPLQLKSVKLVTNELAEVVGLGDAVRKIPSATAVADAMDAYKTTLSAYTRSLAADLDERDAESCRRFFEALAPIDLHRSSYESGEDETGEETDVVPVNPTS